MIDFIIGFSLKSDAETSEAFFSEFTNSFELLRSSKNTSRYSGNDGANAVALSCNALVPEHAEDSPWKPRVAPNSNFMNILVFKPPWLPKQGFQAQGRCAAAQCLILIDS